MNINEFRKKVAESKHADKLQSLSINLNLKKHNKPINLNGLSDIYRFYYQQYTLWSEANSNLPENFAFVREAIKQRKESIVRFLNSIEPNDENWLVRQWENVFRNDLSKTTVNGGYPLLTADMPEVVFLLKIIEEYPNSFTGAYEYIINERAQSLNDANYLKGVLLAYEFDLQDNTDITQRRSNEKISLGKIRSEFQTLLSDAEKEVQNYSIELKKAFENKSVEIDGIMEEKGGSFDKWFGDTVDTFNKFDSNSKQSIADNEKLYKEKLRLEAPVTYWSRRAMWMNTGSIISMLVFIAIVIITTNVIYDLLIQPLDVFNSVEFFGDPGAVKWTVVFITLLSFLAYLIRSLARITFSFLHLARDAEERKQLTHVYLALSEESVMSKEDREIVLQSIFSRADTGLLKGDSSPTMPGIIIEKFRGIE